MLVLVNFILRNYFVDTHLVCIRYVDTTHLVYMDSLLSIWFVHIHSGFSKFLRLIGQSNSINNKTKFSSHSIKNKI